MVLRILTRERVSALAIGPPPIILILVFIHILIIIIIIIVVIIIIIIISVHHVARQCTVSSTPLTIVPAKVVPRIYQTFFINIRRPRPEPWPGRRLGPPLVWTSSAAKLKAVASQVFLFLAKPKASNASNLSKPAK